MTDNDDSTGFPTNGKTRTPEGGLWALTGPDGVLLEVSPSLGRALGRTPDELSGLSLDSLFPGPPVPRRERAGNALREGGALIYPEKLDLPAGPAGMSAVYCPEEGGGVRIVWAGEAEKTSGGEGICGQAELERLAGLVYLCWEAKDGGWRVSEEGRRVLGIGDSLLTRSGLLDLVHPEDRLPVEEALSGAQERGEDFNQAFRLSGSPGGLYFRPGGMSRAGGLDLVLVNLDWALGDRDALRESEERFRALADLSPASLYLTDGRVVHYANPAFAAMLGAGDPSDLVGRPMDSIVHPDFLETVRGRVRRVVEEGRQAPLLEMKFNRLDGRAIWVEATAVPVTLGGQRMVYSHSLNVTARKQAEAALSESERLHRTIFENTGLGTLIVDEDAGIVLANAEMERLTGFSRRELEEGMLWTEFVSEEDRDRMLEYARLRRMGEGLAPRAYGFSLVDRGGRRKSIWATVAMIPGTSRNVATFMDLTELERIREELRSSRERYRQVVENAQDAIYVVQDGRVRFANPMTAAIFGCAPEDLARREYAELLPGGPLEAGPESPESKGGQSRLFRLESCDGQQKVLQVKDVAIDWEGRPATLNLARDVTRHRQMEERIRQAQKLEAVGTLAGGLAHDFNNILSSIMGYGELAEDLARDGLDNTAELAQIMAATERAGNLVRQILAFSRKAETRLRPLDANRQIRGVAELLKSSLPKMIAIKLDLAEDLPRINGDPIQLEQVFMVLAGNAKDAMPEGGVLTISTRREPSPEPGRVVITVEDTGLGMDGRTLNQIFNPFFTTKEPGRGVGLGLSTVHGIIEGHGGVITCRSEPGKGTGFRITLPVLPESASVSRTPAAGAAGGGETVLVVDDEVDIRTLAQRFLGSRGYRVLTASSGEEALEVFRERGGAVDLTILDLGMPGMGGERCLARILEIDPGAKVLVASGYSRQSKAKGIMEAGARGFVPKPYRQAELLLAVRRILDGEAV